MNGRALPVEHVTKCSVHSRRRRAREEPILPLRPRGQEPRTPHTDNTNCHKANKPARHITCDQAAEPAHGSGRMFMSQAKQAIKERPSLLRQMLSIMVLTGQSNRAVGRNTCPNDVSPAVKGVRFPASPIKSPARSLALAVAKVCSQCSSSSGIRNIWKADAQKTRRVHNRIACTCARVNNSPHAKAFCAHIFQ
jgi:hypothetical protein